MNRGRAETPVAVFAYNRPQHVRQALEALAGCGRFAECRPHVICDGPKRVEHEAAVAETRQVVRAWASRLDRPARILERDENLGLARSIVSGVSELCAEYGRVIVVEDDLIVGPGFLDYMLQALARYEAAAQVYQVAGYMYPVRHAPKPDAVFLPVVSPWGWATWERAWRIFEWEPPGALQRLDDPETRNRFEMGVPGRRYTRMLQQRLTGENDSWSVLWRYAVFNARGLALYPRRSLVWVGGFDGSGVHAGHASKVPMASLRDVRRAVLPPNFAWPDCLAVDEAAVQRVRVFLKTRGGRRSWVYRVWRKIGRSLGQPAKA